MKLKFLNNEPLNKKIFYLTALSMFIIMPILSLKHGMSGDEWSLIIYGNDIYNYFFNGSDVALDYDKQNWAQVAGLHYYGGLYDFTITFLHKNIFSSFDELTFRHIINSLVGALLFLYTGLLAKLFSNWRSAIIALILIALSPRILGESMNNPKDIPFAFANVFFLYYLVKYVKNFGIKSSQWKFSILMGIGFGMAMGFRIGGILMIPYSLVFISVYYFFDTDFKNKINKNLSNSIKLLVSNFVLVFIIGYIIGIMFWPWALQDPLTRPWEALEAMTHREVPLRMLYNGAYIMNTEVPKTYVINWIFISTPIIALLGLIACIITAKQLKERYSFSTIFILFFTLIFPVAYAIYKSSVLYDTWRHFFFIYPSMVILVSLLYNYFFEKYIQNTTFQISVLCSLIIGLILPLMWIIRSYPNEYVYFNEFNGGIKNAKGVYDLDYYQNSGKQCADWIKENTKVKGKKTIVASNMSQIFRYFEKDTALFDGPYVRYNDRDGKDWDYYITYSRYISIPQLENQTWPPKNAVHVIEVDGVPLAAVLERKTKLDMEARAAMERQSLDTAFALYQKAVAIDASDDGVLVRYATLLAMRGDIQNALKVLDDAVKIDANNLAIYNLRAQIYKAIGDVNKAQQAENILRSLTQ